jgi:hypothetical protein
MSISNLYPQIRPSLNLDFANSDRLDPRITFTRASTGTFFNSAGVLTSAAVDAPRFDYNPSTLAAQGLLIEEARTNLLTYSAQYDNAAWTKEASVSVSANTTVAPDGTTTGDTVTADVDRAIYQSVTATIGTTYCQSVFIKAGTATSILFRDDTGAGRNITINPSTGAITATGGTLVTSGSQAIGNGWWRYWFAYVADATTVRGLLRPSTGGAAQTYIVWGAQTEAGSFPTSYIPTTTTALTRSEDKASVNTLSPWYNASAGTLYADFAGRVSGIQPYISMLTNTGETERIYQRYVGGQYQSIARVANVDIASVYNTTEGSAVNAKIATAYDSSQLATSTNGQAVTGLAVASLSSVPSGLNKLWLGSFAGTSAFSNGYLRRVTYYPRRLSNAELQAITA